LRAAVAGVGGPLFAGNSPNFNVDGLGYAAQRPSLGDGARGTRGQKSDFVVWAEVGADGERRLRYSRLFVILCTHESN